MTAHIYGFRFRKGRGPRTAWAAALAVGLLAAAPAPAQTTYTWTATASGNFSVGTNWQGGTAPPSGGDPTGTLRFAASGIAVTATNNLGNPFRINRIEFANSTSIQFGLANAASNTLQLTGASPSVAQLGVSNVSASAAINLAPSSGTTAVTATGAGNLSFSGIVSGAGGLTITGTPPTIDSQSITLSGNNSFTGGVTLNSGNLVVGNNNALGASGSTLTVAGAGSTLRASAVVSALAANVVLNADLTVIGTNSNLSLTFAPTSVISGAGGLVVRAPFNSSAGQAGVIIQSASTYGGDTTVDLNATAGSALLGPSALTFAGTSGSALSSQNFNVRAGGILTLSSSTGTVNNNRIADTAAVNLRSGEFNLTGTPSGGPVNTETVGALSGAGSSTVTARNGGGGGTRLTVASLARVERGTFLFRGTNLGATAAGANGNIFFTVPPAGLVGGGPAVPILPYAIGSASDTSSGDTFVTYDATVGVRPLNVTTEYATTLAAGANVRLTGTATNNTAVTVNALAFASSGTLTGTGSVAVTSGAVLNSGSPATITNALTFGGTEANVFAVSDLTVSGGLTGTNGLTKSGAGTLVLTADNTGLTGPLTVNAGLVSFAAAASLPGTGAIVANGGTTIVNETTFLPTGAGLEYTGAGAATLGRNVQVNTGLAGLEVANAAGNLTLGGTVSGAGGLYKFGPGQLTLTGTNTYTGPTRLEDGTLAVGTDAALGTGGTFNLGGGTLLLTGTVTSGRPMQVTFPPGAAPVPTPVVDTNGFDLTWAGPISGIGGFEKRGAGTLSITSGNNPFQGNIISSSGTLRLADAGAITRAGGLAAIFGGTVNIDNTGVSGPAPDRVNDAVRVDLIQGTLRLTGSSLAPTAEAVGQLRLSRAAGNVVEVLASGGQATTLTFTGLGFSGNAYDHAGSTVEFRGTNLGAAGGSVGRIFINSITTDSPVPGATALDLTSGTSEQAFDDVTNAVGVRPARLSDFTTVTEIRNPANGGTTPTTANVRLPATTSTVSTVGAANTIQSLRMQPVSRLDASSGTLTLTSGVVYVEAGTDFAMMTGGTLTAGTAPLRFSTVGSFATTSAVGGTGGLVKDGPGEAILAGAYNTTGGLFVHGGTLTLSGPFPAAGVGGLATTGGTLTVAGGVPLPVTQLMYYGGNITTPLAFVGADPGTSTPVASLAASANFPGGFVLAASGTSTFAQDANTPGLTHTLGPISGGGGTAPAVVFTGPADNSGTFTLSSGSTFTGGVSIAAGTVVVSADSAFGAAANGVSFSSTNATTLSGVRFNASVTSARQFSTGFNVVALFNTPDAGTTVTLNNSSNSLSGNGRLVKDGAGTLVLDGPTTFGFVGAIDVNGGRLLVNGSTTAGAVPAITVNAGGTLGGTGTIRRPTTINPGGTLAPGASPGILIMSNGVTLAPGSTFAVELNGSTAGTGYDQLQLNGGSIALGGATLATSLGFDPTGSAPLTIITGGFGSAVNGTFAGLTDGTQFLVGTFNSQAYNATINYTASSVVLSGFQPVPEPAHVLLLCGAAAAVAGCRRRAARRSVH